MNQTRQSNEAAAIAAVSVRNLVDPNDTAVKLFISASDISLAEKSPSGPISMIALFFSGIKLARLFRSCPSQ